MKIPFKGNSLKFVLSILFVGTFSIVKAQNSVVIGGATPNPNAVLTLIGNGNQAVIIPASSNHTNIPMSPGMLVYNTTDKTLYYCDGTSWKNISSGVLNLTPGSGIGISGTTISNTGDTNAADDITTATTAGGDLTGNYPNPTVARIRGVNVSTTAPTNNQVLQYNGTNWTPTTLPTTSLPTLSAGQLITNNGTSNVAVTVSGDATFNQSGALTIGTGAINSGKIADGTISTGDMAAGSITGGTTGVIADNTITNADIAATAGIAVTKLAAGTNGQVLTVAAGAPTWQTPVAAPTDLNGLSDVTIGTVSSGQILVNNGSGQFQNTTVSGDIAINNTGVATIQPGAISGGVAGDITDGTVTNADISASANIAGTKIVSNFGSQDLITTGNTVFNGVTNTWPGSQGAASTFLQNDGAGNLSWAPTPSPFSAVNNVPKGDGIGLTSSQIFSNGANVGIGTSTPSHRLSLYNPTEYSLVSFHTDATGTGFSDGLMIGLDNDTGGADIWNWENQYIQIGTSGVARIRIEGTGGVTINNFTKLGADAPAIKVKKITGTTSNTQGGSVSFSTGIPGAKIISVTVMVEYFPENYVDQGYTNNAGYQFNWFGGETITVWNTTGNSVNILSKPLKILVTYEE